MANDYIKLWVKDYRALLEPFNEAERGRILWAMMDYKETGSEPKFLGNERFVWAAIKAKIDASNEAYERQAAANRANGARGGRPRKSKENQENPENRMGFEESTTEENPEKSTGPPDDTRKATGSGLDATVCLRPTWQQNFGICEKPGWKMLWWLLRWKKRCATKRSTHGAMLSAYSIRQRRSTLQRLQSGKKLTSKIKEIGLTEKRRAETTF